MRGLICILAAVFPAVAAADGLPSFRTRTVIMVAVMEARQERLPRTGRMPDHRNLSELTDGMAEECSRQRGWLRLDRLASITDRQADRLARHPGALSLRGKVLFSSPNSFTPQQTAVLRSSRDVVFIEKGFYD